MLKKSALATATTVGGVAAVTGSASADPGIVDGRIKVVGQGEFTLHFEAENVSIDRYPEDLDITESYNLWALEGVVDGKPNGNEYWLDGDFEDWAIGGYKQGAWDSGVSVYMDGQEQDESDW